MKKSEKAAQVSVDYILEKFVDLMDSDATWAVKVKGLELLGKYLNMFQDQKKVDINIRSLIAGASLDELQRLAGDGYGEVSEVAGANPERYLGMHSTGSHRRIRAKGPGEREDGSGERPEDRGNAEGSGNEG